MKTTRPRILAINGGSSSIKFALFEAGGPLRRILEGEIERIGLPEAALRVKGLDPADNFSRPVPALDHTVAVGALWTGSRNAAGNQGLTHTIDSRPSGYRAAKFGFISEVANVIDRVRAGGGRSRPGHGLSSDSRIPILIL
jgi:Acetokinase family